MKYDAITLDTNIFMNRGLYYEGGIINELTQFKQGSAQFVLSEIVHKELYKHTRIKAKTAKDALDKSLKEFNKNSLLSTADYTALNELCDKSFSPEDAAKQRLDNFIEKTGCTVLPSDQADIKELVKRYFTPLPPFEETGDKKNEFPDAIALLSLEKWAKDNNKKILAISDDKGWRDYAAGSTWIDVESDLAGSLQKFQKHTAKAEKAIQSLLSQFAQGKQKDLLDRFTQELDDAVSSMSVYAEYDSIYECEDESTYLTYEDFELQLDADGGYEFNIVRLGKENVTLSLSIQIKAKAYSEVSFSVWDSVDKDSVPMGIETVERDIDFDASVLVTITGDITKKPSEIDIEDVEIIDGIDSVDFGYVELDLSSEDYEE